MSFVESELEAPARVERPWMDPRDLWTEALAGVLARPVRSALTTLGTVLGITTLVITIGVASTAGNQIVGRFDALTATSVTVTVPEPLPGAEDAGPLVPWSGTDAVARLAGVESVAALADSDATDSVLVRANDVTAPGDLSGQTLAVVAASAGLPAAVHGLMTAGRFYDAGDIARRDHVVVLGDQAAQLLGIKRVEDAPAGLLPRAVVHRHRHPRRDPARGAAVHRGAGAAHHRGRPDRAAEHHPRAGQHRAGGGQAGRAAGADRARARAPGLARRRGTARPVQGPRRLSRTTPTASSSSSASSPSWSARSASPM